MGNDAGDGVAWSDSPDFNKRLYVPIYSPKVGGAVDVVLLGDAVVGVYTHFSDRRTTPCTNPRDKCLGCLDGIDRRWKGYLAALDRHRGRFVLAEITKEAFGKCRDLQALRGKLRGYRLKLMRAGESKNSRVVAELTALDRGTVNLPPAFDVKAALAQVWYGQAQGGLFDG